MTCLKAIIFKLTGMKFQNKLKFLLIKNQPGIDFSLNMVNFSF